MPLPGAEWRGCSARVRKQPTKFELVVNLKTANQLADKAARTVVLLTERLDHHRGRGQQQITVKHVTTNNVTADQAIITDSVNTGGASPSLLAASSAVPMTILNELPDPVGVGGVEKKK